MSEVMLTLWWEKNRGTFHSIKNSGTFKMMANVKKISRRSFWKIPKKLWKSSDVQTIWLEIPEILVRKSNAMEIPRENFLKIWVYCTLWDCPLFRKFWKILFHLPLDILEIQTRISGWMESVPGYTVTFLFFCSCSDRIDFEPRCCASQLCILLQIQVSSITENNFQIFWF